MDKINGLISHTRGYSFVYPIGVENLEGSDDRSSDEEDYYTNLWKTNLEIDPVIFRRSKKHVNAKIKEIQELSGHLYKNATKSKDDDTLSDGKDFCTWKPDMETRQKAKRQIKSKIKQINTSSKLCKKAATKVRKFSFRLSNCITSSTVNLYGIDDNETMLNSSAADYTTVYWVSMNSTSDHIEIKHNKNKV
ncbi:unnamed protein product [Mytilus coruscus]|uniref:Uncharacterized protein n=1 Tax=Mytilus coruscus TaxID=42192 RepID=A0A6J8CLK9_MYTCO|nr:unnamed protein product [Mytilus coruscus]